MKRDEYEARYPTEWVVSFRTAKDTESVNLMTRNPAQVKCLMEILMQTMDILTFTVTRASY